MNYYSYFSCLSIEGNVVVVKLWEVNKKGFAARAEMITQGEFEVLGRQGRVNNEITPQRDGHSLVAADAAVLETLKVSIYYFSGFQGVKVTSDNVKKARIFFDSFGERDSRALKHFF